MPPLGNSLHFCPKFSSLTYDIHFSNIFNLHLGKYYFADKCYLGQRGILTAYSKIRYHQSEFCGAVPRGYKEIFNRSHSSLRSCIERAFGYLKARWKILHDMPRYSIRDQNRSILATFALHNYIRRSTVCDPAFKIIDEDPDFLFLRIHF